MVGVYGVLAYDVTQRKREIGVACGLVGALALTQLMAASLFRTSPLDLTIYALVSVGLVGIAALAAYVPARRASLVHPVLTLRGE